MSRATRGTRSELVRNRRNVRSQSMSEAGGPTTAQQQADLRAKRPLHAQLSAHFICKKKKTKT